MNEHIFELAIKCGIIEMDQRGEDNTAAVQEFAEMIVRECIPFVGDPDSVKVKQMKEHFGVK